MAQWDLKEIFHSRMKMKGIFGLCRKNVFCSDIFPAAWSGPRDSEWNCLLVIPTQMSFWHFCMRRRNSCETSRQVNLYIIHCDLSLLVVKHLMFLGIRANFLKSGSSLIDGETFGIEIFENIYAQRTMKFLGAFNWIQFRWGFANQIRNSQKSNISSDLINLQQISCFIHFLIIIFKQRITQSIPPRFVV